MLRHMSRVRRLDLLAIASGPALLKSIFSAYAGASGVTELTEVTSLAICMLVHLCGRYLQVTSHKVVV